MMKRRRQKILLGIIVIIVSQVHKLEALSVLDVLQEVVVVISLAPTV